MTEELYIISFKKPDFVCEVLDELYIRRNESPIQFYEEKVKGIKTPIRLYRPVGVLGVVPLTINLTNAVLKLIAKIKKIF